MELEINFGEQSKETKAIRGVAKFAEKNEEFLVAFEKFVMESGALGLAANQLIVDGKVCKHRVCGFNNNGTFELWINPKLLEVKGQPQPEIATCLTFGFERLVVADRVKGVKVSYANTEGKVNKEIFEDSEKCQAVQHVLDHLDGIPMYTMPLPTDIDDTVVDPKDVINIQEEPNPKTTKNKIKRERKKKERKKRKF